MTWADRSNNETHFRLEVSPDSTTWQLAANPGANTTSYVHTGLQAGTTYWFRIRSEHALAVSFYSNVSSATTHAPPAAPQAPTVLTAVQQPGTGNVLLQWMDNADNENEVPVERSVDLGVTWLEIARLGPDVTSYVDSPPAGNTVFTYRVRACNANGCSAYSDTASVVLSDDGEAGVGAPARMAQFGAGAEPSRDGDSVPYRRTRAAEETDHVQEHPDIAQLRTARDRR
ncbi:MAG: fibronectin type III domain-containing protein [Gemmatimonadetes bacterium]|nr:fibronectin type III domain-containing protein [Gemmatimonadota bacterium]